MARGMLVEPLEYDSTASPKAGKKLPIPTPIAIARKIHSVR
jgi:hypothetical protein